MVIARTQTPFRRSRPSSPAAPSRPDQPFERNGFHERASAPPELMPQLVGAAVHSHRYATFIRETDLRAIGIRYDESCGTPGGGYFNAKAGNHIVGIFAANPCPVVHLGYIGSHVQRWISRGTALGEVVYSLSLAPGESRNVAVIDLRRRQQTGTTQDTTANERLDSRQEHTFALQEVATAVALEHQFGKTATEASTFVTGGAFVAAGAAVGGIAGALIGTAVEPGGGTAIGAGLGAAAGVAAGGLVFAGSQAIGMIEAASSGDRTVMADTSQRIGQATSQQSALIRNLWSTVVTEDVQDEQLSARTSNVTNYNHMHALNMEYYEILHGYEVRTEFEGAKPILYLPFGALDFAEEGLVVEFWDSVRLGLPEDLQEKGHRVFVEPPPPAFVAQEVPATPAEPAAATVGAGLAVEIEVPWDFEPTDAGATWALGPVGAVADQLFNHVELRVRLADGTTQLAADPVRHHDESGASTFKFLFRESLDAHQVRGFTFEWVSAFDFFDAVSTVVARFASGVISSTDGAQSLGGLGLGTHEMTLVGGRGTVLIPWEPTAQVWAEYFETLAEIDRITAENEQGREEHDEMLARLAQWREEVVNAIKREPYRFTMIVLSAMEAGRLTWILDRLHLSGDDDDEGSVPLHAIAHTTPIGISSDSVLLELKELAIDDLRRLVPGLSPVDAASRGDLTAALLWGRTVAERFSQDNADLAVGTKVFLPGAGVFAEAILGRANGAEYVDPDRYWNWQDSPIPHQAPQVLPVSTNPRHTGPLDTTAIVPDATLPLVAAPDFPDPVGLGGVLGAVQNGLMFRDMSKTEQLTSILGGLAELAGSTAQTAAGLTGDAAAQALTSATDIGRAVAAMAQQLMQHASPQAAAAPKNPTVAQAATKAVENSQSKPAAVQQATGDAYGVPAATGPDPAADPSSPDFIGPPRPPVAWRPQIDAAALQAPGQMSNAPALPPPIQSEVEADLLQILDDAAESDGAMPAREELLPHMERWYAEGVAALLVFARSNEEYLNSAIKQWADWAAAMQQMGLDDDVDAIYDRYGDAKVLMRIGLENAIAAAFDQMEAHDELEYALDVFNWVAQAAQIGIEDESAMFNANGVATFSPLRLTVSDPIIPHDLGPGQHVGVVVSGGLAIGANPPLAGKTVDVTLTVDNGTATPAAGTVHPTLILQTDIERGTAEAMKVTVQANASLFNAVWAFDHTGVVEVPAL